MCKSKKEKRKMIYNIEDVIRIKKAIDEVTFILVTHSIIESIGYYDSLLSFSLDLGELLTGSLKDSKEPVLLSKEYDFDTSVL